MERHQPQQIKRQVVLPWSKALEISFKAIRNRLGRNLLTMGGVVLAIAFLVNVWIGSLTLDGLRQLQDDDADYDRVQLLLSRLGESGDEAGADHAKKRNLWLVSLSLLVCVVGVFNAMLMSVAERFREIGTMKCLGALAGFILKLFLLESTFLGGLGTFIGMVLGLVLALMVKTLTYGVVIFKAMPWMSVLMVLVVALLTGTLLSVFAALYPAYHAARMQPVEAMRVQQ